MTLITNAEKNYCLLSKIFRDPVHDYIPYSKHQLIFVDLIDTLEFQRLPSDQTN